MPARGAQDAQLPRAGKGGSQRGFWQALICSLALARTAQTPGEPPSVVLTRANGTRSGRLQTLLRNRAAPPGGLRDREGEVGARWPMGRAAG